MRVLFVHQNFPGQFGGIAGLLTAKDPQSVAVVTDAANANRFPLRAARYKLPQPDLRALDAASRTYAARSVRGRAAAHAMMRLRADGFVPDVVVGHPGWGEMLYVRDVFPDAAVIVHAEYWYAAAGADVGFDPEFSDADPELGLRLRAKNFAMASALADCDRAVAPTKWQAERFPPALRGKIAVVHEGIDTRLVAPNADARFACEDGREPFGPGDEVITFVNRNLEPMRGYHVFMRALPRILAARPNAHVVIVGGTDVSYNAPPPRGRTWREIYLDEVRSALPMDRVRFVGRIPYPKFVALMQVSRLHVYLTWPFVLSWSMLEAMSAGAPLLASNTPPVAEFVADGVNGRLVDFFDVAGLADRAIEALADPAPWTAMRRAARETVIARCDRRACLAAWLRLIGAAGPPGNPWRGETAPER